MISPTLLEETKKRLRAQMFPVPQHQNSAGNGDWDPNAAWDDLKKQIHTPEQQSTSEDSTWDPEAAWEELKKQLRTPGPTTPQAPAAPQVSTEPAKSDLQLAEEQAQAAKLAYENHVKNTYIPLGVNAYNSPVSDKYRERERLKQEMETAEAKVRQLHDAQAFADHTSALDAMSPQAKQLLQTYATWYANPLRNVYMPDYGVDNSRQQAQALSAMQQLAQLGYSAEQVHALVDTWNRQENERFSQELSQEAQRFGDKHPVLGSIASVPANLIGGMTGTAYALDEALKHAGGRGTYETLDPNLPGYAPSQAAGDIRQTVAQDIEGDQDNSWIRRALGKAGSVIYQGTMSAADNLLRVAVGGGTGSLALAGMGSFQDTYRDVASRGGDATQAMLMGLASAGVEALTEKFSVDNLLDTPTPTGFTQLLKNAAIQGGIEVTEEEASFLGNLFFDALIMGDKSEYNLRVAELSKTMTRERAQKEALKELALEAAETAAVSFVSGGMMSAGKGGVDMNSANRVGKALYNEGLADEDVRAFIDTGLESDKSSESYALATRLQQKLENGQKLTNTELGALYRANIQAVSEEQAKSKAPAGEDSEAQNEVDGVPKAAAKSQAPVNLEKPAKQQRAGKPAVEAPTAERIKKLAEDFRDGVITEEEFDQTFDALDDESVLSAQEFGEAFPSARSVLAQGQQTDAQTFSEAVAQQIQSNMTGQENPAQGEAEAPVNGSVAEQIRQEQIIDGGTQNVNTYERTTEPAVAQPAGKPDAGRTGIPDGGRVRNAGESAGEQTGFLAGGAAQQRRNAYTDQGRTAVARQNYARSLRLEKVSSIDLGLQNGTEARNIQIMHQESWDAEMSQLADRIYNETGKGVTYVVGRIQIRGTDGTVGYARGVITGDGIIVQADHMRVSAEQIADHEAYHAKVDFAAENRLDLNARIKQHILDTFSAEQFQKVLDKYIAGLRGVINVDEARTIEEFETAVRQIEEEIFADAYAGINAFGAGADQFTGAVNEKMDQLYMGKIRNQDNGTEEPTGPPDMDRYSVERHGQSDNIASYQGRSLTKDPEVYSYNFLISQPPMKPVKLPPVTNVRDDDGRIDPAKVAADGIKNALSTGVKREGKTFVKNRYTGRDLWVTAAAIRHGLNGPANRVLTNARLGSVIGEIVRNAIPINALHNTADAVEGTYAMAGYAFDEQGREFVAIVTVEQRTGNVTEVDAHDVTHALSGRQKRSKQVDTKSQGINPSMLASKISIVDLLAAVKSTYRSILSEDVIEKLGESKNTDGYYTGRVRYSYAGENANNADLDALARAKEMQAAGVADETIRQQTGWHTGMDGKWRWEIDDSGMRYDSSGDLRGAESARWAMEDYESARDDLWGHADMDTLEEVRAYNRADIAGDDTKKQELYDELINGHYAYYFDQYVKAMARAKGARNAPAGGTLQDYIDHPALFEAYPQLRNVTLRFERMGGGNMGYYDRQSDEIVLNAELRYAAEDTLVHEIQHAIQKAEGFARGSNEEYWQRRQDGGDAVHVYDAKIQDSEKKMDEIMRQLPENVAEQFRQWSAMDESSQEAMMLLQELDEGPYGELFNDYFMLTWGLDDMRRTNYKRGARDLYRNTAGEIEARDVTARRSLTPEQRRSQEPAHGDPYTVFMEDSDELSLQLGARYSVDDLAEPPATNRYISGDISLETAEAGVEKVAGMEPVARITGGEFAKGEKDLITQVTEFFAELGNRVYNPQLGSIVLDRQGVKSDIAHGIGRKKAAAFAAVPDVLARGYVVDYQKNWKGRGYDTAVVAAPVQIGADEYLMGVVLNRNPPENKFYVHEVMTTENGASPFKTGTRKGDPSGNTPSVFSILDKIRSVKNGTGSREKFSFDDDGTRQPQEKPAPKKQIRPVAESRPLIAKRDLRNTVLNLFSIPGELRSELGTMIESYADRLIKNGGLTEDDRKAFFDRMYESGVMTVPADEYYAAGRNYVKNGRIYIPDSVVSDFGDDWNDIRRRAFAAGIYLTRSQATNGHSNAGIDVWNGELAADLPGLFDAEETDQRTILERIVQVAEEGKAEKMSLPEYTAMLSVRENISEDEFLDNMERQLDWALRTFAEKASLEVHLRDRTGKKIAQEREGFAAKNKQQAERQRLREAQRRADERQARQDSARRARERKELRELQQRTLKQLQWLSKNRNRAPEELKATWDEVLGDIDLFAVGAANEMRWSDKHNATWKDLAQMYKDAMKNDPNFMPSKELERIVTRLDGAKIADMDLSALQDLYKAAVGLRTEFYNRNNVINDEMQRLFAEVYTDAKREIESAPGGFTGGVADKFLNLDQLTPMNVLQRMAGWDPDGAFYSMAKQLERGERDMRAYSVKAQKMLQDFLTEHEDWVKKADGQGKDAIWYEVEVPQLLELHMGDKPIFGPTVKVYMTPAQKVHMYLESKNLDNLRHMTGGRTFVDKDLYSKGKRQEALSQGHTIKLAPETVRKLVSDLTAEEMELAQVLDRYYNTFATQEINKVSNILYGYDKAMGKNYAPIYTNRNYTKTEFGVFDTTAEGVGNLKGRQYAVNPSYNISAFDAFERHVDQTARFCGMAIPARNWTTLMNWREKNNSTGDVITHKWGEESKRYITDLITTLQGGDDAKSDTVSSGLSKLQSNYISAIFGANPSIVLKQLGSIPLAGAYLDARNLPTPVQINNIDRSLISKYTQELEWRTLGYTTPETKQLKDNPNWTQSNKAFKFAFGGGAITAMDGWAASVLWPWAENKARREHPELEIGNQEQIDAGESPFYKKVAEEFENAISRSQSVSDEIHQGTLRKSKNPITRAFTMFRSDSAQTYNTLRQKIGEARYYMRAGAKDKVIQNAKKAVGTAFVAMLMNAAWSEAASFLMALWKNKGKYYRGDEDELTSGSVAGEMASNMLGSFAGVVTGGEEVFEIIGNILTGKKIYDIETPGMEQLNDLIDTVTTAGGGMRELIAGGWDILKNGGNLGDYFSKHNGQILGSIKDLAMAAATYLPGLPASNLEAYLVGALKWISPELGAAYDDLFSDTGKNDLAGMTGSALEGRVGRILSDRRVSESDDTVAALAALYEAGHKTAIPSNTPASVSINSEKQSLGVYQQQTYDTIWGNIVADALDDMVASDNFTSANHEVRAKMLKNLYDYAAEQTKAELFDDYELDSGSTTIDQLKGSGLDLADCIAWITEISGMKQAEKFAALRNWDMTDDAKRAVAGTLIGTEMETESGKPSQYAKMLDALSYGMTMDQYLDMRLKGTSIDDYLGLIDEGMDKDLAYEFSNHLEELETTEGDDIDDVTLWRASVDFSDNVDDQLAALSMVMTDSQILGVEVANSFGIKPDVYVGFYEVRSQYDADGNGSYKQAEIQATIDARFGHLSQEQKAALWQLMNSSTKSAKNNPYNPQVGQRVLDAKAAAKADDAEEEIPGLTLGSW